MGWRVRRPLEAALVVTQEGRTIPAQVPDNLDHPEGTRWLRGFHAHHFTWLHHIFGRDMALRTTDRGQECFPTHHPYATSRHQRPRRAYGPNTPSKANPNTKPTTD